MSGIGAYRENAVVTQSRGRLIVLMYDGAVKFLRQAIAEIEKRDWKAKGHFINKALAIIEELDLRLDLEAGGDVAADLRALYVFLNRHLTEANTHRDSERIREAIRILEELNEGWKAITT